MERKRKAIEEMNKTNIVLKSVLKKLLKLSESNKPAINAGGPLTCPETCVKFIVLSTKCG